MYIFDIQPIEKYNLKYLQFPVNVIIHFCIKQLFSIKFNINL